MITFKDVQVVIATPEMKTEVYDFWKEVYVYERGYIEESSWLEYVRHDAAVNELATTFCCVYQGQIVATIRCLPLTEGGVIPTLSHFPDLDLSEYDLSKLMDVGKSMKLRKVDGEKVHYTVMWRLYGALYRYAKAEDRDCVLAFIIPGYIERLNDSGILSRKLLYEGEILPLTMDKYFDKNPVPVVISLRNVLLRVAWKEIFLVPFAFINGIIEGKPGKKKVDERKGALQV